MNSEYCAVCGATAEQKHHISYDPEMDIPICVPCHLKAHVKHGVGLPVGRKRGTRSTEKILAELIVAHSAACMIAEQVERLPHYTRTVFGDFSRVVVDAESDIILTQRVCGCKHGFDFQIFDNPTTGTVYLKCSGCGCDWRVTQFQNWRPSDLISITEKAVQ